MKRTTLRFRYFSQLTLLLLLSFVVFFGLLSLVELQKSIVDPEELAGALHEIGFFLVIGLCSVPFVLLLAWRRTRALLEPLRNMSDTAQKISQGRFSERIRIQQTYDELDELASSFNRAFDHYEGAVEKLNNFNANAAHQLRTPLTAIRSAGEIALLKTRSPDEYKKSLGQILEDLHLLNVAIDQLLLLARLEAGQVQQAFVATDLAGIAKQVIERFEPLANQKQITLELAAASTVKVEGVPALMDQALSNLIDNAIRITPENGTIWLDIWHEDDEAVFRIEDNGPGISADLRNRLFERFRSGSSPDSRGSGLGLAIVQEIMQAHGGSIDAASGPRSGGALFTCRFPIPS